MVGATLAELRAEGLLRPPADGGHVAVKEAVLPFNRFPDVDTHARPGDALDRRGHGHRPHVRHGVREEPGRARATRCRSQGTVFLSLADRDKDGRPRRGPPLRRARLLDRGDRRHRRRCSRTSGIPVETVVAKVGEAGRRRRRRPHLVGQGRPRRQHAPGPRAPRRRHAHPAGRDRARRRLRHHGRRRARRRGRASPRRSSREPEVRSLQEYHRDGQLRLEVVKRGAAAGRAGAPVVDVESVALGPLPLPNPVVAASGTFGHGAEVARRCATRAASARSPRSRSPRSRGRATRRCASPRRRAAACSTRSGCPGPGVDAWIAHDLPALEARGARVIASIWGRSVDDYAAAARAVEGVSRDRVVAVEVNLSCPNVEARARRVRALAPTRRARAIARGRRRARRTRCPCSRSCRRTSPTSSRSRGAALDAGRDRAHARQHGDGTRDRRRARARRSSARAAAGFSGPPIKPIALRAVWEVARALPGTPIIGTGGVRDRRGRGRDAARGRDARSASAPRRSPTRAHRCASRPKSNAGARRTACPASAT